MEQDNTEPKSSGKYKVDDFTIKEWERKIDEEDARWRNLGISLDQMNYAPSEVFALQAKVQALINCMLLGTPTEEAMMLQLKMIIFETMENIRENIEPQILQARLTAGVTQPKIVMPWEARLQRGNGG